MADALLSPAVGAVMWTATAGITAYCARKVRDEADPSRIPLMGVTGAFIFAAQMLNFTIPGTGSSGHIGGGLILAILLGPEAAFLVMASVLTVQALFFADGGLLALGANIFNLGMIPAFLAYVLVYKRIVAERTTRERLIAGSMLAGVAGVLVGALGVVLETTMSGVSSLPFTAFAALMLPIHLVIGLVEGAVTAAVVLFVSQAQPDILLARGHSEPTYSGGFGRVLAGLALAAVVAVAGLPWFAATNPDGLEWSVARVTGDSELASGIVSDIHRAAASVQEKTAMLPGYGLRRSARGEGSSPLLDRASRASIEADASVAGLTGGVLTLGLAAVVGLVLRRRRRLASAGGGSAG